MIIFVTLAFAALAGMAGLVVDYGAGAMDFRLLQNATDAAALSATIAMVDDPTTTATTISTMMSRNQLPTGTTTSCAYVDGSGAEIVRSCTDLPPSTASGVKIGASATRSTYLMGLLGRPTLTVSASSTAQGSAETVFNAGASLFIVCGYNTSLAGGGTMNILEVIQPSPPTWLVDVIHTPSPIGKTFRIHDETYVAPCGVTSSQFKGLNGTTGNVTLGPTSPLDLTYSTGQVTSIQVSVPVLHGCLAGSVVTDCVMLTPIAVTTGSANKTLKSVRWLPFWVTKDANGHTGRLLGTNYVVSHTLGTQTGSWSVGTQSGPVSVRLAN